MIKKTIRKISNALAWLGGANIAILDRAPTTRGKFVQMGLVLLTTAGIAAVSMSFFINHEVDEPEATAVVVGVFWGLVIFNLDRFLVVSMGAARDKRRLLLMAAPRLCLAIVISLVVSTPITLRIFQSDINYQLRVSQANQSAYLSQKEAKSGLSAQAAQLHNQISQDQAILDGKLPQAVTNPQLQTVQQQVQQLQPQVNKAKTQEIAAYEAWQCELYGDGTGCAGASNRRGDGPIAQAKQQTYEQDLSTYNSLNAQLQTAEQSVSKAEASLKKAQGAALTRYQQAASKALPGLQKQYNTIEGEIAKAHAADQTAINQHTGTLAQLSALWTASAGNATLLLAHLTVMALFFLIELLPVLVKFLLNLGPLDAYEKVFMSAEEEVANQLRKDRLVQRRQADADARVLIKVAEDRSNREQALGIRANAYVAKRMEAILDAALQQWSTQVTAVLNNAPVNTGGRTQPGGPGAAPGALPAGTPRHRAAPPPAAPTMPNGAGGPVPAAGPPVTRVPSTGAGAHGPGPSPNGAQPGNRTPPNGIGLPSAGGML
jgi:Domain of unknown function (DUF4407)